MTLLVGLGLANLFVKIDRLPKKYLLPCIFLLCCVGSYAIQNSIFDVFVAFFFGIAGFILTRYGYQGSPFVLGMILGPVLCLVLINVCRTGIFDGLLGDLRLAVRDTAAILNGHPARRPPAPGEEE